MIYLAIAILGVIAFLFIAIVAVDRWHIRERAAMEAKMQESIRETATIKARLLAMHASSRSAADSTRDVTSVLDEIGGSYEDSSRATDDTSTRARTAYETEIDRANDVGFSYESSNIFHDRL